MVLYIGIGVRGFMMRPCILGSALVIALCVFTSLFNFAQAQVQPQILNATTDPYEG
jgi:hypothetical protein